MHAHQEQELETVDDRVDGQHGFPVFSQNVQAHVSFQVNIRMVHLHTHAEIDDRLQCLTIIRQELKCEARRNRTA